MNIQIFGLKKCNDSQKAERFFKERKIQTHFCDLKIKNISKGELNAVTRIIPLEDLIDTKSKQYEKKNLKYIIHDIAEVLLEDSLLLKTPIVRFGTKATVGYCPDTWTDWIFPKNIKNTED